MSHTLRFIATLKGLSSPSLDITDSISDETHARLTERLRAASESPLALTAESQRLRQMLDSLARAAGVTRADLAELYDFQLELK